MLTSSSNSVSQFPGDRLAVLETKLRRQTRVLAALIFIVTAVMVLGAGPGVFEEIKARRFVVSDEHDNPRALMTSHKGSTMLSLFDSAGRARVRISVANDGHPEVHLMDQSGRPLIRLAEQHGDVVLSVQDSRDHGQVTLGQNDQQFGVNVTSGTGDAGVRLRASPDLPQLALVGQPGSGVVQMFAHPNKSGVSVSGPEGQPTAVLSLLDGERPLLLLQGRQKRTLIIPQDHIAADQADRHGQHSNAPTSPVRPN